MGNGKGEGREEEGDPTWYGLLFINNSGSVLSFFSRRRIG